MNIILAARAGEVVVVAGEVVVAVAGEVVVVVAGEVVVVVAVTCDITS